MINEKENNGHITEEEKNSFYKYVTTTIKDLTPFKLQELSAILKNIENEMKNKQTKSLPGSPRFVFNNFDDNKQTIKIFTDGSGEDGNRLGVKGAWAVIAYDENNNEIYKASMAVSYTSVNRMELTGVIEALKVFKNKEVNLDIYTDSMYVWYTLNPERLEKIFKNFNSTFEYTDQEIINDTKNVVPNIDLVMKVYTLLKSLKVRCTWVKGHVGIKGNESADELANYATKLPSLKTDIIDRILQHRKAKEIFTQFQYLNY